MTTSLSIISRGAEFSDAFKTPLRVKDAESLLFILNLRDAENAGLSFDDVAGFDLLAFNFENSFAVVRTMGLGPLPEQNVALFIEWE